MIGTAVGALLFIAAGAFNAGYRRAVLATFQRPNAWLYSAGVASSLGQILYFAALTSARCRRSRWSCRWRCSSPSA